MLKNAVYDRSLHAVPGAAAGGGGGLHQAHLGAGHILRQREVRAVPRRHAGSQPSPGLAWHRLCAGQPVPQNHGQGGNPS